MIKLEPRKISCNELNYVLHVCFMKSKPGTVFYSDDHTIFAKDIFNEKVESRYDVPSTNGSITHVIGNKTSILYVTDQGRIGMCSETLDPIPSISYAGGVNSYSFSPLKQDEKKAFALACTAGEGDRELLTLVKVGGKDILVVDLATHARQTLKGSKSVISSICAHPFSSIIATLSVDGELRLWDTEDGTMLSMIETGLRSQQGQSFLTFDRDGTALVVGVQGEELLLFSALKKDGKSEGDSQTKILTLSLVARREHEAIFACATALPSLLLTLGNDGVFQAVSTKTLDAVPVIKPLQLDDTILATWIASNELAALKKVKAAESDAASKNEIFAEKLEGKRTVDIESLMDRTSMKEIVSACKTVAWSEDAKAIVKACNGKCPQLAQAMAQHGFGVDGYPFQFKELLSFARSGEKSPERMMLGGLWPHAVDIAVHPTACCFAFVHEPQLEPSFTLLELSCTEEITSAVTRCGAVDMFWKDEEIEDVNASQKTVFVSSKYIIESDCSTGDSTIICDLSTIIEGYGEKWKAVKFVPFHEQREYALLCSGKSKARLFLVDLGKKRENVSLYTESCAKIQEIDEIADIAEVYYKVDSAKKSVPRNHDSIYALDTTGRVVTLVSLSQPEFQQSFSIVSNMDGFRAERLFSSPIPGTIFLVLYNAKERRLVRARIKEELIYANCSCENVDQKEKTAKKDKVSKSSFKKQGKHAKNERSLSKSEKRSAKNKIISSEETELLGSVDELSSVSENKHQMIRFSVNVKDNTKLKKEKSLGLGVSSSLHSEAVNGVNCRERSLSMSEAALPTTSLSPSVEPHVLHVSQSCSPSHISSLFAVPQSSASLTSALMSFVPSLLMPSPSSSAVTWDGQNSCERYSLEQSTELTRIYLAITAPTDRSFHPFIAISDYEKVRIVDDNLCIVTEVKIPKCGPLAWIGWTLLCISEERGKIYAIDVSGKCTAVLSLPCALATSFAFVGVAPRSLVLARCTGDTITPFFCEVCLEHLLEQSVIAAAAIPSTSTETRHFSVNRFLCLDNETLTVNKLRAKVAGSDSHYDFISNARHVTRDDPFFARPRTLNGFGYSQLSINVASEGNRMSEQPHFSTLRHSFNSSALRSAASDAEGSVQARDGPFDTRKLSRAAQTLRAALLRKDVVKSSPAERRKTFVGSTAVQQSNGSVDNFEKITLATGYASPLPYPQVLPFTAEKVSKKARQQRDYYFPSFLPFSPFQEKEVNGKLMLDGISDIDQIIFNNDEQDGGGGSVQNEADYDAMNKSFIETWGELRKPKRKEKKSVFRIDSLNVCDDYLQTEVVTHKRRALKKRSMKVQALLSLCNDVCIGSLLEDKLNDKKKVSEEKASSSLSKKSKKEENTKKSKQKSSKNSCDSEKRKTVKRSHSIASKDESHSQKVKKHTNESNESISGDKKKKRSQITLSSGDVGSVEQTKLKRCNEKTSAKHVALNVIVSDSKSMENLMEMNKDAQSSSQSVEEDPSKKINKTKHLSIYNKKLAMGQSSNEKSESTLGNVSVEKSEVGVDVLSDVPIGSDTSSSSRCAKVNSETGSLEPTQDAPDESVCTASDNLGDSDVNKSEVFPERDENESSDNEPDEKEPDECNSTESDDDSESDSTESDEESVPDSSAPVPKSGMKSTVGETKPMSSSPNGIVLNHQRNRRKQFSRHHTLTNMTAACNGFVPRFSRQRPGELTKAFGSSTRKLRNVTMVWNEETDPLYVSGAFSAPFADDDTSDDSSTEADPDVDSGTATAANIQDESPLFDAWEEKDYVACDECCRNILLSAPLDRHVALRCAAYRKACSWLSDESVSPLLAMRRVCDLPLRRADRLGAFRTTIEMCIKEGEWRMAKRLIVFVAPYLPSIEAEYGNAVKEAEVKKTARQTLFPEVECYNCGKLHSSGDKSCTCASPGYFDYPHKNVTAATTARFCNFCKACYCADQLSDLQRTKNANTKNGVEESMQEYYKTLKLLKKNSTLPNVKLPKGSKPVVKKKNMADLWQQGTVSDSDLKSTKSKYKSFFANVVTDKKHHFVLPGLQKNYVPQGLGETKDWFLISAYYGGSGKKQSMMFVVSKATGEVLKAITLPTFAHVGGIAASSKKVYVCSDGTTAGAISIDRIKEAQNETALAFEHNFKLKTKCSYASVSGGLFFAGTFEEKKNGVVYGYKEENGKMIAQKKFIVPPKVQGITFFDASNVVLSRSYGRKASLFTMFTFMAQLDKYTIKSTMFSDDSSGISTIDLSTMKSSRMKLPPMSEGILKSSTDGNLYVIFESAAVKYYSSPKSKSKKYCKFPMDRIVAYRASKFK